MGVIAKVLSFTRRTVKAAKVSDVKIDEGGGPPNTAQHFAPAGIDSHPLPNDYALSVPVRQAGRSAIAGYVDPDSSQKSTPGDVRVYSRDGAGEEPAEIWVRADGVIVIRNGEANIFLSPDGSLSISNTNGSAELSEEGTWDFNGVTIDSAGAVNIPTSLTLNGKEIADHIHAHGTPNTGPNL